MKPTESIWRNRDIGLLVSGSTINNIGDWLLDLALPVYVFSETRSGITTAFVFLVGLTVNAIFGPLGGRLADTWRLKPTLITTNVLQALALLPLLAVTPDRIWPVFLVAIVQGLIKALNDPAAFALLPRLVEEDQLIAANSAMSAGFSISRLFGAAAGGFAIEFGGMLAVVLADGATFLIGALTAWLLSSAADNAVGTGTNADHDRSVRAGLRELRSIPGMNAIFSIQGLSAITYGSFPLLFIVFITEYLDGSGSDIGLVRACSAFGGLLAAAVVGSFSKRLPPARLMTYAFLAFGAVSSLFVNAPPFTTALWVYMILYGSTGFPNIAAGVGMQSTIQQLCPPRVMGRLGGVSGAIFSVGMGLGSLWAGVALEFTTARTLLNLGAASLFSCGLIGLIFVVRQTATDRVEVA